MEQSLTWLQYRTLSAYFAWLPSIYIKHSHRLDSPSNGFLPFCYFWPSQLIAGFKLASIHCSQFRHHTRCIEAVYSVPFFSLNTSVQSSRYIYHHLYRIDTIINYHSQFKSLAQHGFLQDYHGIYCLSIVSYYVCFCSGRSF